MSSSDVQFTVRVSPLPGADVTESYELVILNWHFYNNGELRCGDGPRMQLADVVKLSRAVVADALVKGKLVEESVGVKLTEKDN